MFNRGYIFVLAFLFYVLHLLWNDPVIQHASSYFSALLIISALIGITWFYGILAFLFLSATITIAIQTRVDLQTFMLGFDNMIYFIIFLGMLPLIALPLRIGGYMEHISRYIQQLSTYSSSFLTCNMANFVMGSFVNMATLPISHSLFMKERSSHPDSKHYMVVSNRAIALAVFWSPVGVPIPMAVFLTGVSLGSIVATNLTLAVIGVCLSSILAKRAFGNHEVQEHVTHQTSFSKKEDIPILLRIFMPFILYIIFLFIAQQYSPYNMVEIIVMSMLPFVIIWSMLISRLREFFQELNVHFTKKITHNYSQFAVLLSAGFFIYMIEKAGIIMKIQASLPAFSSVIEPPIYIIVTLLVMVALSFIGVHQFITFVLVGTIIDPQVYGIHPNIYATTLITGIVICMMTSPFSGINLLMSSLVKDMSSYKIGSYSFWYALLVAGLTIIVLVLVNYILTA